jgi:hypothetical protein
MIDIVSPAVYRCFFSVSSFSQCGSKELELRYLSTAMKPTKSGRHGRSTAEQYRLQRLYPAKNQTYLIGLAVQEGRAINTANLEFRVR